MKAYKAEISKTDFVKELKKHQKADAFLRGSIGSGEGTAFRGCAVACSLKSISTIRGKKNALYDHSLYPLYLGIPEWLARLEDTLFENMPEKRSRTWPVEFAQAIRPGADLEKVKTPFIVMLLKHSLKSMKAVKYDEAASPAVKAAIDGSTAAVKQMIAARKSGDAKKIEAAESAASAARSAASAARSAASAESAARSAESAAWSAASAAESAARSAESAARSAESAAWSAESAARSAASAAFEHYADELLKILKATK